MNRVKTLAGIILALSTLVAHGQSEYDSWNENYIVQALLGAVRYDALKLDAPNSNGETEIDISTLPQVGGTWATLPQGDRFQYGLETTMLVGAQFDDVHYLEAGGGGVYVTLDATLWTFDLSGGGYISYFIDSGRRFRIYAAGGPMMIYADYQSDESYSSGIDDVEYTESAFGIGGYARLGLEFRITDKGMLGAGVRGNWANLDLSGVGGETKLSGAGAFVTFTVGL